MEWPGYEAKVGGDVQFSSVGMSIGNASCIKSRNERRGLWRLVVNCGSQLGDKPLAAESPLGSILVNASFSLYLFLQFQIGSFVFVCFSFNQHVLCSIFSGV